jgi:hypothetical protein
MTLYQFLALDDTCRAETLWDRGVHIGERREEQHLMLLYQINGFYVEVFYDPVTNAISRLRPFSSVDQLQPYLAQIDLSGF